MNKTFDYIVLGLGGLGSAAAYWLSRQTDAKVLCLEQFEPGHNRGGSQDHSRIVRLSYHTAGYVQLARQAYQAWAEIEAETQSRLLLKTGGLDLWPSQSPIPIDNYRQSLQQCDIPFEMLDARQVMGRWPQFQLSKDVVALYQADSGLVDAAKSNATHQHFAREHGAVLHFNTPVTAIKLSQGEATVTAGGTTYSCHTLVITGGAWTNHFLAHLNLSLPLTVTQEQVTYFTPTNPSDFTPERFPIWIWMDNPCFYGFPIYGETGIKAAQDVGGVEVTADTRTFSPDPANLRRVETFLRQTLPSTLGSMIYTKTCLYTMPPDRDFIIDALPEHPNCYVAVGAGHAFKFASLIGKILSQLARTGQTTSDISAFSLSRPILHQANPEKSFLV